MQNKNINIKSIEDLQRTAIGGRDIQHHVRALANHVENEIINAIRIRDSYVTVAVLYGTYRLECFNDIESVKLMVYNIIQLLNRSGYAFEIKTSEDGYYIIINLTRYNGKYVDTMLDSYIDQFCKKN